MINSTTITPKQQPKARLVGERVAYREGFTNIVRYGRVVSVEIIGNGYPVTLVDFPGWKGVIEFAAEALADADQFSQTVNWWAV